MGTSVAHRLRYTVAGMSYSTRRRGVLGHIGHCRRNGRFLKMPCMLDPLRLVLIASGMALIVLRLVFPHTGAFDVPFRVPSVRFFPIRFRPAAELVGAPPQKRRQVVPLQLLGRQALGHALVD